MLAIKRVSQPDQVLLLREARLTLGLKKASTLPIILAATDATEEELAKAKDGVFPDGTRAVEVEKRKWRAQVKSEYIEPQLR